MLSENEAFFAHAASLLDEAKALVLATTHEGASPSACSLFFVRDGLALAWLSDEQSRHSRNVAREARAAAAVHVEAPPAELRGVQLEGEVFLVGDAGERERILRSYKLRHGLGDDFDRTIAKSGLYLFRPRWIRVIDNRIRFGFKAERTLPYSHGSDTTIACLPTCRSALLAISEKS